MDEGAGVVLVVGVVGVAIFVGGVLAGVLAGIRLLNARRRPRGEFLCDACRLDDPRTCQRPERPNATECPDFVPRPGR